MPQQTQRKKYKIAVGQDNFKKVATELDIFVDKSLFIKDIIDSSQDTILITHPRRWGKTMNLDMLKTFFDPADKELNRKIFAGGNFTLENKEQKILMPLQIAEVDSGSYMKYQGENPVIFVSLKDIIAKSLPEIEKKLKFTIKELYSDHTYLFESEKFTTDEKLDFQRYIDINYNNISLENSLKFLSKLLHKFYGRKVYILIDEYDKAVNSLLESYLGHKNDPAMDNMLEGTAKLISQTVCGAAGKTNPYLEKLILVGIFDTAIKETGSGCNNLAYYGIADAKFSTHFGFSEQEVMNLVTKISFNNEQQVMENIKKWYNGYSVPISHNETIQAYTPWAVMRYLDTAHSLGDFRPQNYWTQTGASRILQNLLQKEACADSPLSNKLQNIIVGNSLSLEFDPHISLFKSGYHNVFDNEKIFAYLMLNAGYLTVKPDGDEYIFSIPNFEVRQEFVEIVEHQLSMSKGQNSSACRKLLSELLKKQHVEVFKAITSNNLDAIEEIYQNNARIHCKDPDLNFNYLQIAALSGNKNIFNNIAGRCVENEEELMGPKDKIFGLRVKDYIELATPTEKPDEKSETYKFFLCNPYVWYAGYSLTICPAATALVKFISKIYTPRDINSFQLYGIFAATGAAVTASKDMLKSFDKYKLPICQEYDDYNSIDISSPKHFISLQQFKKYSHNSKDKAYVMLGSECKRSDEIIKTIDASIFENKFYGNEVQEFTLCGVVNLENIAA